MMSAVARIGHARHRKPSPRYRLHPARPRCRPRWRGEIVPRPSATTLNGTIAASTHPPRQSLRATRGTLPTPFCRLTMTASGGACRAIASRDFGRIGALDGHQHRRRHRQGSRDLPTASTAGLRFPAQSPRNWSRLSPLLSISPITRGRASKRDAAPGGGQHAADKTADAAGAGHDDRPVRASSRNTSALTARFDSRLCRPSRSRRLARACSAVAARLVTVMARRYGSPGGAGTRQEMTMGLLDVLNGMQQRPAGPEQSERAIQAAACRR